MTSREGTITALDHRLPDPARSPVIEKAICVVGGSGWASADKNGPMMSPRQFEDIIPLCDRIDGDIRKIMDQLVVGLSQHWDLPDAANARVQQRSFPPTTHASTKRVMESERFPHAPT